MNKQKKILDFTGEDIFIGIDTHLNQYTVTIRTREMELKTHSRNPNVAELTEYLNRNYPNANYYSCYEAGFCGFSLHRELGIYGIQNIVVNPADVPTTHKEKTQKRDKRDSRKLARELSENSLYAIYIPSEPAEALRLLGRLLTKTSKSVRRAKSRIKHFLHTQGIVIPHKKEMSHWSGRFIKWLTSIEFEEENSRFYLDELIDDLQIHRKKKLFQIRRIRKIANENSIIKLLRTVPGVGLLTAFIFYTEIVDIFRFQKLDNLIAFVGLIPSVEASDQKEHILGLTNRCNKYLRYLLIEAAWVAIRKDPALLLAYKNLIKFKSKQRAIIRITKKLINRMRYVWKNQQEYVLSIIE